MVEVMGADMGAAMEEVTVGDMGTAKAQALALPVLSRYCCATSLKDII